VTAHWTGRIRAAGTGRIEGWIQDAWGWTVTLTGTRDTEGGGYILEGTLGDPPDSLRVPAIDGGK